MAPIKAKNFSENQALGDSGRIIQGAPKGFFVKVKSGVAKNYQQANKIEREEIDDKRRLFLKAMGVVGLSALGMTLFAPKADALVMGGTPGTSVMGVKDASNARINPAKAEGSAVLKKTTALTASGAVHTPATGKKVRIYNIKFSLSADMTDVSFRFTSGGTDFEKYLTPKSGGLYGIKNHPNYVEGGADQALYCNITGTGTVQINVDYLEV